MSAHDEQQGSTPEAIAAMYIFHDEYAAQREGAEDFYAHLSHGNKQVVKDLLAALSAALRASPETGWQPISTLTADYKGQFVAWFPSEPCADMMGGWDEYQQVLGFGQTPATHWLPVAPPAPRPQEAE